jgi:NAD(P)-dependent dehydrogenase (short-subunit alcohol dehydrogenase family)
MAASQSSPVQPRVLDLRAPKHWQKPAPGSSLRIATRLRQKLAARLGRIDILVKNAGVARSETAAENVADEHWLNVLDVNLNGTFWCCREFGKQVLNSGAGAIVNIGSMSGFHRQQAAAAELLQRVQSCSAPPDEVVGRAMGPTKWRQSCCFSYPTPRV